MLRLLRNTLLHRRLAEAYAEYRSLKLAEHRAALKVKRAAVRARVRYEVQRAQVERAMLQVEAVRTAARVQGLREVAGQQAEVQERMRALLASRGLDMAAEPGATGRKAAGSEDSAETAETEEFKKGMLERVHEMLPNGGTGEAANRVASEILQSSVNGVRMADGDRAEMSVRLVAGMAKEAGVTWEELERMVEIVERDETQREALRQALRKEMFDAGPKIPL